MPGPTNKKGQIMSNLFSRAIRMTVVFGLAIVIGLGWTAKPAHAQYKISPGDQLTIEVLEDPSLNRSVLVLPDGSISFPFAGTVRAAGRTLRSIESLLQRQLASNFATAPTVFVNVAGLAPEDEVEQLEVAPYGIFLMGEVNSPGRLNVADDEEITLLQAIAQAGGFTRFAATKRIQLRRPSSTGERIYTFNYKTGAGISGATLLKQGDVINVPERRLFE